MIVWFATGNDHKKLELEAILADAGAHCQVRIPQDAGIPFDPAETGTSFLENALIKARELHRLLGACRTCGILQPFAAKFSDKRAPLGVCRVKNVLSAHFSSLNWAKPDKLLGNQGLMSPGSTNLGATRPIIMGPVIADDSGLCVDALDGRPGIYSARYGNIGQDGSIGEFGGTGNGKLSATERNALLLRELGDAPNRKARFVCAMVLLFRPDRFYAVQETLEGELIREARGAGGFGYDPILYLPDRGLTVAELSTGEKNRISHRAKAGRALAKFLATGE